MYAIFETGSRQFRAEEGAELVLDRHTGNDEGIIEFDKVLLIAGNDGGPVIGAPTVAGAKVVAKIIRDFRGKKIIIQKFRRRKNMRRRRGHRQEQTRIKILNVVAGA